MSPPDLDLVAREAVERARRLGADEVSARVARSVTTEVGWRDGRLEKVQESRSLSLRVSMLVDQRFSSHATNDLRDDALDRFLQRAIEGTRALEPDPDRRLPELAQMGVTQADLDLVELGPLPDAAACRRRAAALEEETRARAGQMPVLSVGVDVWATDSTWTLACSNGFLGTHAGTHIGQAVAVTLSESDGRKPEAYAHHHVRHLEDLPPVEVASGEVVDVALRRLGSRSARSGRTPMVLRGSRAARILGLLLAPLHGQVLHEGRSCFADALGRKLSPGGFTLIDDALLPRGPSSRRFDSEGLPAARLPIFEDGVLRNFHLDVYYARKLGLSPTTGTSANLCVPAGARSLAAILADLPQAIVVEGFLGGNVNPATGAFSLGVNGTLYERGEAIHNVSEMNLSGNLFELLERWQEAADDVWVHGAVRSPSLLFDAMQFAGA